jgi:hypothetical protein
MWSAITITDSANNTWTSMKNISENTTWCSTYYCFAPTTGTAHTFSSAHTGAFLSIAAMAFNGTQTSGVVDVTSNGVSTTANVTLGSILPNHNNEIVVTALGFQVSSTTAINESFIPVDSVNYQSGNGLGLATAYLVQTTAAIVNPTWAVTATGGACATIGSFRVPGN